MIFREIPLPPRMIQAKFRQHIYFYTEEENIFDEARAKCRRWYGDLASVVDAEEERFVSSELFLVKTLFLRIFAL